MPIEFPTSILRVGIFQAEWPIQVHTYYSALHLIKNGFEVDLFFYKAPLYCRKELFTSLNKLNLYTFRTPIETSPLLWNRFEPLQRLETKVRRIADRLQRVLYSLLEKDSELIPAKILRRSIQKTRKNRYICFIGVEKLGLIWASKVGEELGIPYIYHSLELYTKEHPYMDLSERHRTIKAAEECCHRSASATIIQDRLRAEVLFRDNNLAYTNPIYVPISLPNLPSRFQQTNQSVQPSILDNVKIIQFGQIDRYGEQLVQLAQNFPLNWQIILHDGIAAGFKQKQILLQNLKKIDKREIVKFSLKKLDREDIEYLVAGSHIGLALYSGRFNNDLLTAFSSEKIALYLKLGLPLIGFAHKGYEIFENEGSGVLIHDISDIPRAIHIILRDYQGYSLRARETFLNHYCFEKNFSKVIDFINQLENVSLPR